MQIANQCFFFTSVNTATWSAPIILRYRRRSPAQASIQPEANWVVWKYDPYLAENVAKNVTNEKKLVFRMLFQILEMLKASDNVPMIMCKMK